MYFFVWSLIEKCLGYDTFQVIDPTMNTEGSPDPLDFYLWEFWTDSHPLASGGIWSVFMQSVLGIVCLKMSIFR